MSGLRLFNLGGSEIRTDGNVNTMGDMSSIGVSLIEGIGNNSITISSGTSIFFDTNNNEGMRITADGRTILGNSSLSTNSTLVVGDGNITMHTNDFIGFNSYYDGGWKAAGSGRAAAVKHRNDSYNSIDFRTGTSPYNAGDPIVWGDWGYISNGVYHILSDDRLKTEEEFLTNALESILNLRPQKYTKHGIIEGENEDVTVNYGVSTGRDVGLIAQEVYYLTPELRHIVSIPEEANPVENVVIPDDPTVDLDYASLGWSNKMSGIAYSKLIPYLIKGIQEQQTIIEGLSARIAVLENN